MRPLGKFQTGNNINNTIIIVKHAKFQVQGMKGCEAMCFALSLDDDCRISSFFDNF
jgi:hypothetical protein